MATRFKDIYSRAVFKFRDYGFMKYSADFKEDLLKQYLLSAISDFRYSCLEDISDNDLESEQFNNDISEEVVEILATGIVYYWLSAKVMNSDLLKNLMSNKDYSAFSPANLLKEMKDLRSEIKKEYKASIATYSFRNGNFASLTT